jgi:transcriptional regulator EpsA
MDKIHWENFFEVTTSSLAVTNYQALSTWLNTKLTKFLSHEMMIYCWGDFNSTALNYDITAYQPNQENIIVKSPEAFNVMMRKLHEMWLSNNSRWFMLNDTNEIFSQIVLECNPILTLSEYQTILVYGIRDMGGVNTCLYVFLTKNPVIKIEHYVIGMLMPYLDASIRRINGMVPLASHSEDAGDDFMTLSKRELEIMGWVNSGKTNYEIGEILSISHNTVKNHLKTIFKKMNVISRAQAASKFAATSKP